MKPAPVFRPTFEEFKDFEKYVLKISTTCTSICKIIPPPEWKKLLQEAGYSSLKDDTIITKPIKQQSVGKAGAYQIMNIIQPNMKIETFSKLADEQSLKCYQAISRLTDKKLADEQIMDKLFWRNIPFASPVYGADIQGTLFPSNFKLWNVNQLPSLLRRKCKQEIPGVTNSYLYYGMWISIEKQLPEPLDGEDFESIKVFLLQEIEKLFEYYVDTEADAKVFEELDEIKEQVESLVLSPKENQSEVSKVSAGPTASAPVYPPIPLPTNKTSHVFISHAWAEDEEGRDNHQRVKYLNDILKKRGIVTWFDDDRIGLDMSTFRTTLAKALYSTCCVLICITKQYEVKVNGGDESDSCHYEFNVVANCKLASARMTAVMERSMLHTGSWEEGRLKAELGPKLFSDLSSDINFEENCEVIVKNIVKMLQSS